MKVMPLSNLIWYLWCIFGVVIFHENEFEAWRQRTSITRPILLIPLLINWFIDWFTVIVFVYIELRTRRWSVYFLSSRPHLNESTSSTAESFAACWQRHGWSTMGKRTHGPYLIAAIEYSDIEKVSHILTTKFRDKSKVKTFLTSEVRRLASEYTEVPLLLAATLSDPTIIRYFVTKHDANVNFVYEYGAPVSIYGVVNNLLLFLVG